MTKVSFNGEQRFLPIEKQESLVASPSFKVFDIGFMDQPIDYRSPVIGHFERALRRRSFFRRFFKPNIVGKIHS